MSRIRAARLFDGERFVDGPVWVDVEGELIRRVTIGAAPEPNDVPVTDHGDQILMPGLINTHTHITRGGAFETTEPLSLTTTAHNLDATLAAGVTTVGDMGSAAGLVTTVRDHVARHPHAGPAIRASGPILTAPDGYPLDWMPPLFRKLGVALACGDEVAACRAVQTVARYGCDHIKIAVMHQSYAETPLPALTVPVASAVVGEAHKLGLRVCAHAHSDEDYRVAVAAGADALMHSSFTPLHEDTVRMVADAGIAVCPTLWVFDSVCLGAEANWHEQPERTRDVAPAIVASWKRFAEAYAASGDVIPEGIAGGLPKTRARDGVRVASANLKLLTDRGVPIAFGSDAAYGYSTLHRPFEELNAMQRSGMTPAEVLQAATGNAAQLLGLSDRGRIAEGLLADIVIAPSEIERDIAAFTDVAAVYSRGRLVDAELRSDRRRRLGSVVATVRGLGRTVLDALRSGA
jgi:imidazolonepropionase-like amidohydrolase